MRKFLYPTAQKTVFTILIWIIEYFYAAFFAFQPNQMCNPTVAPITMPGPWSSAIQLFMWRSWGIGYTQMNCMTYSLKVLSYVNILNCINVLLIMILTYLVVSLILNSTGKKEKHTPAKKHKKKS
jgi:hypothetical protein